MIARPLRLALPCLLTLAAPALAADPPPPTVSVIGEAHEDVRPDIAVVSFEVAVERPTAPDAQSEDAKAVAAVLDGLKGSGIDTKDIATVGASLYPVFSEQRDPKAGSFSSGGPVKTVVTGYRAHNEIRVKLRDIERAGAIIGATVGNGALYQSLAYDLSDREARVDALRGKAAVNAAHRAELYAGGLGLKVGPARSLNATGERFEPTPMLAAKTFASDARMASPAPLQIEPGVINLSESVNATFELVTP